MDRASEASKSERAKASAQIMGLQQSAQVLLYILEHVTVAYVLLQSN